MTGHFRNEIAGLRAVAVIGVVLFHLKVAGVQGGFVGVDVFFVISGYLITRNILRDIDRDRFSFPGFYLRRTRRILPPLIFTVVLTYLLGALWCSPLMFLDLAKECTHALLSIANIQYWRESHQYFAPNSDELALLHCWSLSLEEQFYLLWPLFIVLAKKTGRPYQAIAAAALVSLLGAIGVSNADPLAAFFLMPFRIFEFAAGALVLPLEARFRPGKAIAEGLSAGGILCIVASMVLFESDMPHLEAAVLVPCLGAAATIWAGDQTLVSRIITNRVMAALGAISYSLYLCHWPIIFFARFIFGGIADTVPGMIATTACMLAVAVLMHAFVERRFILTSPPEKGSLLKYAALASVILGLAAVTHLTFLSRGLAWRLPAARSEETHLQSFPANADISSPSTRVGVEFIGDSLVLEYEYGLRSIMQQLRIGFRSAGGPGCPILDHAAPSRFARRDECIAARDRALQQIETTDTPIIYAELWRLYDDASIDYDGDTAQSIPPVKGAFNKLQLALEATIEKAVARGHRVLLLGAQVDPGCLINVPRLEQGPLPHAPQPPCPVTTKDAAERTVAPIDRVLDSVAARWPDRVTVLHPVDYFCDSECPVVLNGLWLYNSRIHLSLAGVDYMMRRSEDVFRQFLAHGAPVRLAAGARWSFRTKPGDALLRRLGR
jgi:peptidoglycan/LPS O-acetylase OafA/YrhL